MSFQWEKYLTLAKILAKGDILLIDDETARRSAISRAYYAVFCLSRNFALDNREVTLTGERDDHQTLIEHFKTSPDQARKQIGTNLDRLRKNRNAADYDNDISGLEALTRVSMKFADNLLIDLNSLG